MRSLADWEKNPAGPVNAVVLRLDAPMMSFGGVVVDGLHDTLRYPLRSMLSGLMANALGYDRLDFELQETLQEGFTFASRWDVSPELLNDYQTVDLGSYKMSRPAWKSDLTLAKRAGASSDGTHQTTRKYWAGGVLTAAVCFADEALCRQVAAALRSPARPLFYGRKTCIPAAPLGRAVCWADSAGHALLLAPVLPLDAARERLDPPSATCMKEADLGAECAALVRPGSPVRHEEQTRRLDLRNRVHVDVESRIRTVLEFQVATA